MRRVGCVLVSLVLGAALAGCANGPRKVEAVEPPTLAFAPKQRPGDGQLAPQVAMLRPDQLPIPTGGLAGRTIRVSSTSDIRLGPKEIVLTFDDGPMPGKTEEDPPHTRPIRSEGDLPDGRPDGECLSGNSPESGGARPHRRHAYAKPSQPRGPRAGEGAGADRNRAEQRGGGAEASRPADGAVLPLSHTSRKPGHCVPASPAATWSSSTPTSIRRTTSTAPMRSGPEPCAPPAGQASCSSTISMPEPFPCCPGSLPT